MATVRLYPDRIEGLKSIGIKCGDWKLHIEGGVENSELRGIVTQKDLPMKEIRRQNMVIAESCNWPQVHVGQKGYTWGGENKIVFGVSYLTPEDEPVYRLLPPGSAQL